jgi:DNA-binding response OmpR family regulator
MRILLIEDEPKIAGFIQKGLGENGHHVTSAYDGNTGLSMAMEDAHDLAIVDVMLPGINGLEVCRAMRSAQVDTPVLMLTALGSTDNKVEGLNAGADDYLVKPFHFRELVARTEALLRRARKTGQSANTKSYAGIAINEDLRTVTRDGEAIALTAREYNLLSYFMTNAGRVVSRAQIASSVWGYEFDPSSNVVDVYVNYLRNKLEKGGKPRLIMTVTGFGYLLKEVTNP